MNCLFGDPTTVKELPLIDAAAECGCEYYVDMMPVGMLPEKVGQCRLQGGKREPFSEWN